MWRLGRSRLLPFGFLLLGWAIVSSSTLLPAGRAVEAVVVDMQVQQNSFAEFYWNAFAEPPVLSQIPGGQRTTIAFKAPTSNLQVVRIDPTQRANESITIFRVALRFPDGSELEIPLEQVANWAAQNITKPELKDGGLTFRSLNGDPYLYGPTNMPSTNWPERVGAFAHKHVMSGEFIVQLVIVGAAAVALISLTISSAIFLAVALLMPPLILFSAPSAIMRLIPPDFHDVGTAIGAAAVEGLSVGPERYATLLAALVAVILGFAIWICTRADASDPSQDASSAPAALRGRHEAFAALAILLALLLALVPDLHAIARAQLSNAYYYHWDSHNVTTWAGFVAQGKHPYVDFWYPYSGLWVFDLPLPYGVLARYAYLVILYWVLAAALFRLIGRPLVWLAIVVLIVLLTYSGVIPLPERYLLGVTVALSYVASNPTATLMNSGRLWFWAACALTLWGEPLQSLYISPALVMVFCHDELWEKRFDLSRSLRRAVGDFAVPCLLLIALVGFLAYRGEFRGFIENTRLTLQSAIYGLLPTNLASDLPALFSISSIGVIAPFILLMIGVVGLSHVAGSRDRRLALAILCCGIIGVMMLQKHLIRPIGSQLLGPNIVGALLIFPLFSNQVRARALSAAVCGAIVAALVMNVALSSLGRSAVLGSFARVASNYRVFANERALLENLRNNVFSRTRMANYMDELAIIDKFRSLGIKAWFPLTDMPIFFLFLEGPTPFQINHYNTAPVRAQVSVLLWLMNTKPEVVILDPTWLAFDGIQLVVREPLVADYVVRNYVPFDRSGPYHLLARRKNDQPIDLAYWASILGPKVEYGRALGYSRAPTMPACVKEANESCARYLELSFDAAATAPEPVVLPIMVGTLEFQASFKREPGTKTQYVPIDRIWFWTAGEAMGIAPTPRLPANTSAKIVDRMSSRLTLY